MKAKPAWRLAVFSGHYSTLPITDVSVGTYLLHLGLARK